MNDEKEFDYMNMIPLVDVMLVLLTIVLTTSTFVATGVIPIELPMASKSHGEAMKTQVIEIDKTGLVYFNSIPLPPDGLENIINSEDRETPILIRADRDIALQVFVSVLDVVKNLGFKRVSLQTLG